MPIFDVAVFSEDGNEETCREKVFAIDEGTDIDQVAEVLDKKACPTASA